MTGVKDGFKTYMLQTKGLVITPLWVLESRERMRALKERLERDLEAEIPSWMTLDIYLAIKKK